MKVTGQCHCGAITFSADIKRDSVVICHCSDCQTLSGAAYRVVVGASAATFRLTGTPSIYVKTTADSGAQRRQAFCPRCGTPIYSSEDSDTPQVYGLRVGAIHQRAELTPTRQIWSRSALPWVMDLHDLPSAEAQT
jgi:hypothetical protein